MVLDLKDTGAHAEFLALADAADVLVENFRPGTMERLGLGWERLSARNPRLVWCAITGFGRDGPYSNLRAYDPVVQACSGIAATQEGADGAPALVQSLVVDKVTALHAAQAITAALFHRERSGAGQRVEVAMLDAAVHFNWPEGMYNHAFLEPTPAFPEYGTLSRLMPCADGHVSMGAIQDVEFAAIRAALGEPEALADPVFTTREGRGANLHRLLPAMAAEVARHTRAELMAGFCAAGAVGCRANSRADVLEDPQVLHNALVHVVEQPGAGPVRLARHPARFSATPARPPSPAPA
jgi:crotonobetainyl-CoA:carnitine CoA-transferase CaiB-like acyl-CoA transferase